MRTRGVFSARNIAEFLGDIGDRRLARIDWTPSLLHWNTTHRRLFLNDRTSSTLAPGLRHWPNARECALTFSRVRISRSRSIGRINCDGSVECCSDDHLCGCIARRCRALRRGEKIASDTSLSPEPVWPGLDELLHC